MDTITKQQIPVLGGKIVEFLERFSPMSKADAQWTIQNTAEAIGLFLQAVKYRELKDQLFNELILSIKFALSVDYSRTMRQMIDDSNFGFLNRDINAKNFPLPSELIGKKIEVIAKIYQFNCCISSKGAIEEMAKDGYRPANLAELLAFKIVYPRFQLSFPILALGSIWDDSGFKVIPYLSTQRDKPSLELKDLHYGEHASSICFLAVRK